MPSRDWGLCGDFPAYANVGRKISMWGGVGKMWGFGPISGGKSPHNMSLTLTLTLTLQWDSHLVTLTLSRITLTFLSTQP